ncbi:MAG: 4-alpha-glucanotransferase, partial [Thermoanaerobaculia bacterium]
RAANNRGILVVGDAPIYVSQDSADVWANRGLFQLDERGRPTAVSGVPPDYFSPTGQLWGNPLYRWDRMEKDGFAWWIARLRANLRLCDLLRIDHFRAFAAYWSVPAGQTAASNGMWVPAPGEKLFAAARQALGALPIVAEDLGVITPDVEALLTAIGVPGMKVLQFAFYEPDSVYLPHRHVPNSVVYTGTHDNDTARGWFAALSPEERVRVTDYLGCDGSTIEWDLIRAAYTSVCDRAIVPLQDVLGLGSEARMNNPAEPGGNWAWRAPAGAFRPDLAARLRRLADLTGR